MGKPYTIDAIMQSAAAATGNGTALEVSGCGAAALQVSGTFVGTVTFEGTVDGSNWVSVQVQNVADGTVSTTATAAGVFLANIAGLAQMRARVSTYTSGAITVRGMATESAGGLSLADVDVVTGEILGITAASGAIASGAVASGAIASGAIASGAMVAGAQADGHSATLGLTTAAPAASDAAEDTTARVGIALWKGIKNILLLIKTALGGGLPAALGAGGGLKVDGSGTALPVSGTFWQGTQPVSVSSDASGAYTTPTHTAVTVTTTSGQALAANANRIYALFQNDSDTAIYLKIAATAVANQGIRLNANGGSYEMSLKAGNLNTGAVNAIHGGTGNKTLLVTEGV